MNSHIYFVLLAWLVMAILWFGAIIPIAMSKRGNGTERAVWALVAALASWLGYVGFLLSTRDRANGLGMRNG